MFKRRLAVLGAVAVLTVTGLAGSALADGPAPAEDTKVTCTTSDGRTVELVKALPAEKGVVVRREGKVARIGSDAHVTPALPEGEAAPALPEGEAPEAVKIRPLSPEELEKLGKIGKLEKVAPAETRKLTPEEIEKLAPGDVVKAMPALPALPTETGEAAAPVEGWAKTAKVVCEKPE
ncbi:hypothetical protein [Nonomuraea candida]|uniref:hypothetical protein n=1 Tax=Nonomuraea candida TaxID=359159 RepID=UPI0005BB8F2C|nr:hypothetical protein [Nonomuraea candida]